MSRRGENIYRRKDRRWEGRVKIGLNPGGTSQYKSFYGHTYGECRCKMRGDDTRTASDQAPRLYLNFKKICEAWLVYIQPNVKESTFLSYHRIAHQHIIRFFSSESISCITRQRVDTFVLMLLRGKRQGLAVKTVHNILIVLRSVFSYAELRFSVENPMKGLKLPRCPEPKTLVFNDSEWRRIAEHASAGRDTTCMAVQIAMYTGMRIGELCALKKEDIDFTEKVIYVRRTVQRIQNLGARGTPKTKIITDTPKSCRSQRKIPVPEGLLQTLERLCRGKSDEAYLLGVVPEKVLEPRTMQYRFQMFLQQMHLPKRGFHILRHTFATRCIEKQVDIKTVSEILGHTDVKITLERYVHSSMEFKRRQINRICDFV